MLTWERADGTRQVPVVAEAPGPLHDPPLEPRDAAVFLLTAAAEIEHALMVQHLYAAYSIRVADPNGPALETVQNLLTQIAREEMGHLATARLARQVCDRRESSRAPIRAVRGGPDTARPDPRRRHPRQRRAGGPNPAIDTAAAHRRYGDSHGVAPRPIPDLDLFVVPYPANEDDGVRRLGTAMTAD
jgi:hypothetical protein